MTFEDRVRDAFALANDFQPSADLFARVRRSIEEDKAYRRRRAAVLRWTAAAALALGLFVAIAWRLDGTTIPFWAIEAATTALMATVVLVAGPVVRRFGERFESAVFHADPGAGSNVLRLLDIAYYLIFSAYVVMTISFERTVVGSSVAREIGEEVDRVGGLLLLMGVLHIALVVALPVVGLVFSANERRARRSRLGSSAPPPDRSSERIDTAITWAAWVLAGLAALWAASTAIQLVVIGLGGQ